MMLLDRFFAANYSPPPPPPPLLLLILLLSAIRSAFPELVSIDGRSYESTWLRDHRDWEMLTAAKHATRPPDDWI